MARLQATLCLVVTMSSGWQETHNIPLGRSIYPACVSTCVITAYLRTPTQNVLRDACVPVHT